MALTEDKDGLLVSHLPQFNTGSSAKFGVQPQYLDGERHLVGDALSGAVVAGEEFKVLQPVVLTVPVLVVNRFFASERATERLFDHIAMFQLFVRGGSIARRESQNNVPSFDAPRYLGTPVLRSVNLARPLVFALAAAKFLLVVDRSRAFAASFVKVFSAVLARRLLFFIAIGSASHSEAWHGTIKRVFSVFLTVRGEVTRLVRERLSTSSARELNRSRPRGGATMRSFMRKLTISPTETLCGVSGANLERATALLANLLNRHFGYSLSQQQSGYHGMLVK